MLGGRFHALHEDVCSKRDCSKDVRPATPSVASNISRRSRASITGQSICSQSLGNFAALLRSYLDPCTGQNGRARLNADLGKRTEKLQATAAAVKLGDPTAVCRRFQRRPSGTLALCWVSRRLSGSLRAGSGSRRPAVVWQLKKPEASENEQLHYAQVCHAPSAEPSWQAPVPLNSSEALAKYTMKHM